MRDTVLEIRSLSKSFGRIQAVKSIDLQIHKGSVYGILGPNGSGKTTTLAMILGVTRPDSGTFSWFGDNIGFDTKKRIGALLETPNFYPYLSAYDNLKLVATIKELPETVIEENLKLVNLWERAGDKFKNYSLGMKQRLAIASALMGNPEVLVLDEPTNGLDPQGIAEVRELIADIAERGITVILASHMLVEIEKLCSHVAVLQKGQLLFSGLADELTGSEGVVEMSGPPEDTLREILYRLFQADVMAAGKDGITRVKLKSGQTAAQINKALAEEGVFLDHLVFRRNSLEEQFLNLLKNNKS